MYYKICKREKRYLEVCNEVKKTTTAEYLNTVLMHKKYRCWLLVFTESIDDGDVAAVVLEVLSPEAVQRHQDQRRSVKPGNNRRKYFQQNSEEVHETNRRSTLLELLFYLLCQQ